MPKSSSIVLGERLFQMQLINPESTTHKTLDGKFGGYLVTKDFLSPDVCDNLERELIGFFSRHGYFESDQPMLLLANRDSSHPYQKLRRKKEKVDDRFEEKARVLPVKNTLCSFVNSKNAIHAVTPYQPAVLRSRMFFYFSLCVADKNLQ